jgi:hypothetical protein
MSDINAPPRIQVTTVVFTPTSTDIFTSSDLSEPIDVNQQSSDSPYLRLTVFPTSNGKNIQSIEIYYFNPTMNPPRLNEILDNPEILAAMAFSMNGNDTTFLDKLTTYMRSLPSDDVSVIIKEYTKYINGGLIIDGFVAGIASYLAFLLLNENSVFVNQMPFQFCAPFNIDSCNSVNRNMFQYISFPLTSLCKISHNILLQLVLFIQSFINIWDPLFIDGPVIGPTSETRMCMDIISGFSHYVSSSLAHTQSQNDIISQQLSSLESRLQSHVDITISKMKRELHNLIVDTRASVDALTNSHTPSEPINTTQNPSINKCHPESSTIILEESTDKSASTILLNSSPISENARISDIIQLRNTSGSIHSGSKIQRQIDNETSKLINLIIENKRNELINEIHSQINSRFSDIERQIDILHNKLNCISTENISITNGSTDRHIDQSIDTSLYIRNPQSHEQIVESNNRITYEPKIFVETDSTHNKIENFTKRHEVSPGGRSPGSFTNQQESVSRHSPNVEHKSDIRERNEGEIININSPGYIPSKGINRYQWTRRKIPGF